MAFCKVTLTSNNSTASSCTHSAEWKYVLISGSSVGKWFYQDLHSWPRQPPIWQGAKKNLYILHSPLMATLFSLRFPIHPASTDLSPKFLVSMCHPFLGAVNTRWPIEGSQWYVPSWQRQLWYFQTRAGTCKSDDRNASWGKHTQRVPFESWLGYGAMYGS